MKHKFNLKAAECYGKLLRVVPEYSRDNFANKFKEFLNAYDDDNESPAQNNKTNRAWSPEKHAAYNRLLDAFITCKTPDEICNAAIRLAKVCQREPAEQRTIPKVGEVYRTSCAGKIKIIAVIKDRNGCVVVIQAVTSPQSHLLGAVEFLPLTNFEQMGFTKED